MKLNRSRPTMSRRGDLLQWLETEKEEYGYFSQGGKVTTKKRKKEEYRAVRPRQGWGKGQGITKGLKGIGMLDATVRKGRRRLSLGSRRTGNGSSVEIDGNKEKIFTRRKGEIRHIKGKQGPDMRARSDLYAGKGVPNAERMNGREETEQQHLPGGGPSAFQVGGRKRLLLRFLGKSPGLRFSYGSGENHFDYKMGGREKRDKSL